MNKLFHLTLLFAFSVSLIGCGGSSEPTNMMEGAGEEAMKSYEEMIAADEAMMSEADAADEVAEEPAPTE